MLVTNSASRAPLSEVLNHPWMLRGFNGPPDSHLVHRDPLRADELDKQVIRGMKGFEFGEEDEIEKKLVQILESDAYIRAVQVSERKRDGRNGHGLSNSSLAISFDHNKSDLPLTPSVKQRSKRFSGLDFYRRKLFSSASSPPATPSSGNSPPNSQSHLSNPSTSDTGRDYVDPTRGFHPLISMYYLAREKLERERVYGPGHFASSKLSLHENASAAEPTANDTSAPPSSYVPPSQASAPKKDTAKVDYGMALPHLPAPENTYQSGMSYDVAEAAPSPTAPGFPQPRPRDAGIPVPKAADMVAGGTLSKSTTSTKMPRAPPASTHRRSHSFSQRPTFAGRWAGMFGEKEPVDEHGARAKAEELPRTAGPELSAFADKMREANQPANDESSSSHVTAGATLVKKFGSLLVGRGGDDSRKHGVSKRATILGLSPRPSADEAEKKKSTEQSEEGGKKSTGSSEKNKEEDEGRKSPAPKSISHSLSQPLSNVHRRATTLFDPNGRTTRHERRSSTGGALLPTPVSAFGRNRRPSTGYGANVRPPGGMFGRTEEEEIREQDQNDVEATAVNGHEGDFKEEDERHTSEKDFKPLFLKGLFRYMLSRTYKLPAY